jgi:hypothetical protein
LQPAPGKAWAAISLAAGSQSHQAVLCGAWDPAGDDSGRRPASDRPWNPGGRTQRRARRPTGWGLGERRRVWGWDHARAGPSR